MVFSYYCKQSYIFSTCYLSRKMVDGFIHSSLRINCILIIFTARREGNVSLCVSVQGGGCPLGTDTARVTTRKGTPWYGFHPPGVTTRRYQAPPQIFLVQISSTRSHYHGGTPLVRGRGSPNFLGGGVWCRFHPPGVTTRGVPPWCIGAPNFWGDFFPIFGFLVTPVGSACCNAAGTPLAVTLEDFVVMFGILIGHI